MHLKEIDLYGFKSFGERVKIEFNPRLTAIVGPNGSGKSNIVDSVRWLLGDQSQKGLRVPSSEEVIFKGIDNGAPFNFSHVGIVVDLAEEGEIQIERKFHRSGENEYVLNGKTVRLKDIRNLLSSMGFGLGSLSILSQGQIDSILSLVPTDRRIVLEEVAQISHFKENKSRILKKLDSTRDNLTRLEDILREVDSRIKELAEQAESAREYRKLSDSQSELSIKVTFKETERLVKSIRRNLIEIRERENELSNLKRESVDIVQLVKSLDDEIENLRNKLEHEMELSRTRTLDVEKIRSSMDLAGSEHESLVDKRVTCLKSVKKTEMEIDGIFRQIENEKEKFKNSSGDKQDSEAKLSGKLERDKALHEEENKDLISVNERQVQINRMRGNIDIAISRMEMLEEKLARSVEYLEEGDEAFQDKSSELKHIDKLAKELDGRIEESSSKKSSIQAKKDQATASLNEIEKSISELESQLGSQKDELIETASELRILMDLEKKLAGFHFGVKKIIEADNRGELKGIKGPVVNLLKVDPGFEKALESILGGRGQYVLVDSFKDGINALDYLKATSGGRVTFIPLDDFKQEKVSFQTPEISESEGYLGKALDRIVVHEEFQHVIEYLLRDALIFHDLESARTARKKYDLKQWIVTLDGDIHRPKGIFTGGSTDVRGEGPLVRRSY
ncbi:MAG: AAA family ATPase, partial [bacterium]